jgi:hypothetical protein
MRHKDYLQMEEDAAIGELITKCMRAILAAHDADTLARLQRKAYKYTEAGVSVGFQFDDGTYLWNGDKRAHELGIENRVRRIGVSSIIEGSDAQIPVEWLDLLDIVNAEEEDIEAMACKRYDELVEQIDAAACALWDEVQEHDECEHGVVGKCPTCMRDDF